MLHKKYRNLRTIKNFYKNSEDVDVGMAQKGQKQERNIAKCTISCTCMHGLYTPPCDNFCQHSMASRHWICFHHPYIWQHLMHLLLVQVYWSYLFFSTSLYSTFKDPIPFSHYMQACIGYSYTHLYAAISYHINE